MIDGVINSDTFIFYFFYPRFSVCCWIFLQLFIYFFDIHYLFTYFIVCLLWITLAWSPYWKKNITPILRKLFFSKKQMHKLLKGGAGINILSSDDINYVKSLNSLIDNNESEDVIAQTKDNYNIKEKSFFDSIKDAKKGTAFTFLWIELICDFFEKLRNLFQWEDPTMSFYFLLLLIVLYIFVSFLPLKFIFSLSTFHKFYKGRSWQKRRKNNNEEVCKIELQNFIREHKCQTCITDFNDKWESQILRHKDNDYHKIKFFEKALTHYFQQVVRIYLPKDILNICPTPNKLIEYAGTAPFSIKLPNVDRNEKIRVLNPNIRKRGTPMHYHLHNFIFWRIPSDFYTIRKPGFQIQGEEIVQQKSRR